MLSRRILCFLLLLNGWLPSGAQDTAKINFYYRELKENITDSLRITDLCNLAWEHAKANADSGFHYAEVALAYAQKVKDLNGEAFAHQLIGVCYEGRNNVAKAAESYLRSISISEKTGNKKRLSDCYGNLGNLYFAMNKIPEARAYAEKTLKVKQEIGQVVGIVICYANLGDIMASLKKPDSALYYYGLSVKLSEEIDHRMCIAYSCRGMGKIYKERQEFSKALENLNKALLISEKDGDMQETASAYMEIGSVLCEMKKYSEAIANLEKAYTICTERKLADRKTAACRELASAYEASGDHKNALRVYKEYKQLQDSVFSKQNFEQIGKMQADFANQKKEQERQLEERQKEFERKEAENRRRILSGVFIAIAVLVIGFAFWRARARKKANEKLSAAYALVEEKNKDITDSINYARRIQEAILPSQDLIRQLFPKSFVLFRPRDVVSGDFYWFSEKNGKKLVAAVDCTGHGVPGAFMSMIGNAFLDEIVDEKGITRPDLILSELRHQVIRALKQTGALQENKDGMDIAVLSFDEKTRVVEFAGANNPLWLVRNNELIQVDPDKRHIGYFKGLGLPFNLHKIELRKGDALYIFTDGYADQFGGPKGKKFKYRQLKERLISLGEMPMEEQHEALAATFSIWKGNLEQVDDVLVIGIKV